MIWTKLAISFAVIAALLAGFAAYVQHLSNQRTIATEAAYPPEGEFVTVEGLKVHGVVMGAGPDLVLIHGASGKTRDFTIGIADQLAKKFRLIILDRPGLGYSDALPRDAASLEDQARILQQAATAFGAETPLVLGQSYGGAVALAWAINHPENISGLITLASVSNLWLTGLDGLYALTTNPIGNALVVPLLSAFAGDQRINDTVATIFEPQDAPENYGANVGAALILRPDSWRANAYMRKYLKEEVAALVPRYGEITVPTEILHGTSDTIVPHRIHSDKLQNQIADNIYTKLDGIGHMPQHVSMDDVEAALDRLAERAGLR